MLSTLRARSPRALPRRAVPAPRRSLFGWTFPVASDAPLAGTADGTGGPPLMLITQIILGLPALLWAYKCGMMVLFQRRIIYMPSIPPGTRNETLDGEGMHELTRRQLSGLEWSELEIASRAPSRWLRRPVKLRAIELEWGEQSVKEEKGDREREHVAVLYLQGNAGTPLLRLPLFRKLLSSEPTPTQSSPKSDFPRLTLLAVAPRSYWLSTRTKPMQPALIADYNSALEHLHKVHPRAKIVLYGHSLGGACTLHLAEHLRRSATSAQRPSPAGVIVENPMPSIPAMVRGLYPQKWLPYHYLGPLAFDKWDSVELMRRPDPAEGEGVRLPPRVPSLWLRSGRDELIDERGVREMFEVYTGGTGHRVNDEGELDRWVVAEKALHDTAYTDGRWRDEMRAFIARVASPTRPAS